MNNMHYTRRAIGMTLKELANLTKINIGHLSEIERAKIRPTERTRNRIENILGRIDWLETSPIDFKDVSYEEAERMVKALVESTMLMNIKEKQAITSLIHKYFK
jgi:transcriptional regulator with XRE-family HTH domain